MKSNIDQFLKETKAQIEKELEKQESEGKKVVLTAYNRIVNRSPVDKGLFRSSNVITKNSRDTKEYENVDESRISDSQLDISKMKFRTGDQIIIQNNSVYGARLESGYSKQAPAGIYSVTEVEVKKLLNRKI